MSPVPPKPPPLHYAWVILALAVLAIFAALGLGRFGYAMVLPAMQGALGLSNTETGALQSWNLLGYMLTVAVTGALAAHLGPRRVIAVALAIVAAAMALTALAPGFRTACAARFLTGVGGAAANVPVMGVVAAWFAARRRGLATGVAVAGSSVGLLVTGPLVPALLVRGGEQGWRLCWAVFAALALAVCLLCALFLRNRPADAGLQAVGSGAGDGTAPVTAAGAGGEPRLRHVYVSGHLWHLAVVYFAFGFSYIIYSTFFVRHLEQAEHMTRAAAGRLWFGIGLVSAASGLLWGAFSDRAGRRAALVLIYVLQGGAILALGLGHGRALVLVSAAGFALTAWSIPAIVAAMTADHFGARLAPAALGVATVVFGFGQVLGPLTGGALADRTGGFHGAFMLAGVVAIALGAGGSLLLRPSVPGASGGHRD